MKKKGESKIVFIMFAIILIVIAALYFTDNLGSIFDTTSGAFNIIVEQQEIKYKTLDDITFHIQAIWHSARWDDAWVVGRLIYYLDGNYVSSIGGWAGNYDGNRKGKNFILLERDVTIPQDKFTFIEGEHKVTIRLLNMFIDDVRSRGEQKPSEYMKVCEEWANSKAERNTAEWWDTLADCEWIRTDKKYSFKFIVEKQEQPEPVDTCGLWCELLKVFNNFFHKIGINIT